MDIYLVYGAPCSGKTTWVKERAGPNDLIIDLDAIKSAICGGDPHRDGFPFLGVALEMMGAAISRLGHMKKNPDMRAFVVGGYASRGKRMRTLIDLNAQPVFIDTPIDICLERAQASRPAGYDDVIRKWFEEYEPDTYADQLYHDSESNVFYHSREWRELRKEVLAYDHYECQRCKAQGKYTKATTVHHVHHLKEFPQYALQTFVDGKRNLISLCDACHNAEHPEKLSKPKRNSEANDEWFG